MERKPEAEKKKAQTDLKINKFMLHWFYTFLNQQMHTWYDQGFWTGKQAKTYFLFALAGN